MAAPLVGEPLGGSEQERRVGLELSLEDLALSRLSRRRERRAARRLSGPQDVPAQVSTDLVAAKCLYKGLLMVTGLRFQP